MDDVYGLKGKKILIVGASDGHGLLFAKQAAAYGASVAMVARGRERLEAAAATITDPPAHPITGDLADQDSIKAAADAAIEHLGGLDVLVISAANSTPEYLSEAATHEQLQRVHVLGTETLIQATQEALGQSSGCIVVISSVASEVPWPRTAPFNVAKAAQHALLRNHALALAPRGVRVNAVLPACIHTAALDRMAAGAGMPPDAYAARRGPAHPLGRCGRPEEVVPAALFLASAKLASFITGQFLAVDGGLSLTNWFNTSAMQQRV